MGKRNPRNIIITGFSYTGKTQVSQIVAKRLGWELVDTDEEIVKLAGKPIPDIFAQDGEDHFRKLERQALESVCQKAERIISTGGGIIMAAENREIIKSSGAVICLEAEPETIYQRLMIDAEKSEEKVVRPLLSVDDPLERIKSLKESRQLNYDQADWTVRTDHLTLEEVASELIRGWNYINKEHSTAATDSDISCKVTTATASYPIMVGWGLLDTLGQKMKNAGLAGTAYLISDDQVFPLYGERVRASLKSAGFNIESLVVTQGEPSKSWAVAMRIYDFLVLHRAERSHTIVALGGGVVGDLAGFIAATFLRGMPLVQVPTSLMAMVDSSIGGKVAVNHPEGKNLIGAFYQPRLVLSDVQTLATLPKRELTSGWAEVIKHGLIRDLEYFEFLEQNVDNLTNLDKEVTTEAIRRSASIKAAVVSEDEREAGLRTILNYGHTIAHGLETATNYTQMLHGEAVAIGMIGAAQIGEKLGLLNGDAVKRQMDILVNFGLPATYPGADLRAIMRAIELDKKVQGKAVRWVLLKQVGETVIRKDVPSDVVQSVIEELVRKN
ncbi:MAG: 3-dehydroquinate synthase [Chloroflexi bacterium]|jgi:shikimate kinase / 3-dehydroquinate synthase|nr:3-dehydroquinate synthase [Chloroflexota bacterium]